MRNHCADLAHLVCLNVQPHHALRLRLASVFWELTVSLMLADLPDEAHPLSDRLHSRIRHRGARTPLSQSKRTLSPYAYLLFAHRTATD